MLMDWQNQYCEILITKSYLPVQYNPCQNFKDINHRDWKIYPKFHKEAQKTAKSQGNIEQKEQCWRCHNIWLQTILQNHSNKNSMILAQKETWRLMKHNRRPRNKSTHLLLPYFIQRCPKHAME
jgi:hypothetical protein